MGRPGGSQCRKQAWVHAWKPHSPIAVLLATLKRTYAHSGADNAVLVMQAKIDSQVPPIVNQTLVPLPTTPIDYREVEQDHSFSNRDALIHTLLEWFN